MSRSAGHRAPCRGTPHFAHPSECIESDTCVVVHLAFRDGTERWGVPLAVVGEMVRFRALYPRAGTLLVPFEALDPESVARAADRCGDPAEGRPEAAPARRAAGVSSRLPWSP